MGEILEIVTRMDPEAAMAEMTKALKVLFTTMAEEARTQFLLNLIGESQGDKVSSMVNF